MPGTRSNSRAATAPERTPEQPLAPLPEPSLVPAPERAPEPDNTIRPQTYSPQNTSGDFQPQQSPFPRSGNPEPHYDQFPGPDPQFPFPAPFEGTPFNEGPNLAEVLTLLTRELRSGSSSAKQAKAKEPDTFDGSDPKKLNNFILLCNLYFRTNRSYGEDSTKVTFALSYLRGMALEYFEPTLLETGATPDWMDNWSSFVSVLRTQFGPVDPSADAADSIDNLKMQDNQHIVKYNVEFNRLAIRTGWEDSVLRHRYYTGLAERIKDIMGQHGKPATLDAMKLLAHSIDSRYWERQREKSRSGKGKNDGKPDKSDKPDHKPDNKSDDKKGSTSKDNSNFKHKKDKQKTDSKPATSSGSTPAYADKLGKDGKLTSAERQRRFDNNLCMFCGGVGHGAKDCPKSSSSASKAKARAAQAKEKETPDPKKG
jgi:hypothetical protein